MLSPRARAVAAEDDFRDLFVATYPRLVGAVLSVVHDRACSEDAVQDAFIELHRQWSRVYAEEQPDAWVRRVAVRKAQRKAAERPRPEAQDEVLVLVHTFRNDVIHEWSKRPDADNNRGGRNG